jgi:methylphosphotriester-DNA--protein-cysteine methyltransferase
LRWKYFDAGKLNRRFANSAVRKRARVTAFARENLAARPSLEAMADAANLSPDYFSRLFHSTYGLAPRDWLVRERIYTAARLLRETDLTIYQIAGNWAMPMCRSSRVSLRRCSALMRALIARQRENLANPRRDGAGSPGRYATRRMHRNYVESDVAQQW